MSNCHQIVGGFATSLKLGIPQWNDSQQSAIGLRDTGVNVPVLTQFGATGIWMPLFTVGDFAVFSHQFSHAFAQTPNVTIAPHVHWVTSTTSPNVVRWELTYQWLNPIGGVIAAGSTVLPVDGAPLANTMQITDFPDITQAGMKISSVFMGRLRRITNGAVDYAGNVFLSFFDIHYLGDTLGSQNELTK